MNIHVIGCKGVVGGATYELFKRLGYDVTGSDKGDSVTTEADVYFICVPEDTVHKIVYLMRDISPGVLMVVRSSVVPGKCKYLAEAYIMHICHNPEFLREAIAVQDEFSPARIVIGQCCEEHGDVLESLYKPLGVPIVRTDPTTSELVKLASNNYLSTVISYWNTVEEVAKRVGVSGHQVGMIASMDPRISPYGARLHSKYGGRCLPKDMDQLINLATKLGIQVPLLSSVKDVNDSL